MTIDDFCARFGGNTRKVTDVMRQWQFEEVDSLLRKLGRQHDTLIGGAVIMGDALHGDGMRDQIPAELRDAFANLMGEKADTYQEMREILRGAIENEDGGFFALEDRHVGGFINKIKGQIGENLFRNQVGDTAELAHSGSQEAWDVVVRQVDGTYEYVQVKLYADPRGVVNHMLTVQEKVVSGGISGCHGDIVDNIEFAVPANIVERVNELKDQYSQLDSMRVLTIPIDTHTAADFVKEGMSNVGPEQLEHFFGELLGGVVVAGSLHALVNGFLWYKGSKEFSAAMASAAASTSLSTAGIGVGLLADTLCHAAVLAGAVGIGSRILLSRLANSRWDFATFMERSIVEVSVLTDSLRDKAPSS